MNTDLKQLSKYLSLLLRHRPETLHLTIDANGWTNINELLRKMREAGNDIDRTLLDEIVRTNEKQRFAFDETGTLIRASQGHTIEVDLQLLEKNPPALLYHGTNEHAVASILASGIARQQRHHVHLSHQKGMAKAVGGRRGKPVVLQVNAAAMHDAGFKFYQSANGVWLTDEVPATYISVPSE